MLGLLASPLTTILPSHATTVPHHPAPCTAAV